MRERRPNPFGGFGMPKEPTGASDMKARLKERNGVGEIRHFEVFLGHESIGWVIPEGDEWLAEACMAGSVFPLGRFPQRNAAARALEKHFKMAKKRQKERRG